MTTGLVEALWPLVGLSFALLFAFITGQITSRMKSGAARDAAAELVIAAETVVRDVEQRLKPALVKAMTDGKLSEEDAADLKAVAVESLKDQLSDQAQKVIKSNGTRLEAALSRAIEAEVSKLKEPAL